MDLFELENGSICPSGLINSIVKVLMDVYENFWPKLRLESESPKIYGL